MQTYLEFPDGFVIKTDTPQYHTDAKRLTKKEGEAKRKAYCREQLLKILKPGDTVYTILRHVSASGMSRRIDLYTIKDNTKVYLSGYAADLMGDKLSDKPGGGIVVTGCGMDMGFSLVCNLGYCLWPNGTPEAHGWRNGEPDSDGGYALKHEWL
jgi:hypothetical protein